MSAGSSGKQRLRHPEPAPDLGVHQDPFCSLGLEETAERAAGHDVDLDVMAGEWVSIVGPNGAGKSTLLRSIAGVINSSGTIRIGGDPVADLSTRERAKRVAWVPQTPNVPPGITVFDYVLLGRTPHLHPLAREGRRDRDIAGDVLDERRIL